MTTDSVSILFLSGLVFLWSLVAIVLFTVIIFSVVDSRKSRKEKLSEKRNDKDE